MTGNNASVTRGRPFPKGNAGRPKGARNKVTVAVESLLDGEAEGLTRKAIRTCHERRYNRPTLMFGADSAST